MRLTRTTTTHQRPPQRAFGRHRAPQPPRATSSDADRDPLAPLSPWLQSPGDILSFGPRAALGALLSLPRAGDVAADVAASVADLLQDPRPPPDKAAAAVERGSRLLADIVAAGAGAERAAVRAAASALPADVQAALPREFFEEDAASPAPASPQQTASDDSTTSPSTSGGVSGRGASEIATVARAARAVADAAAALADAPAGQLPMRRLSAREARAGLARALEQAASAEGGERAAGVLADAKALLAELDDALTLVAG